MPDATRQDEFLTELYDSIYDTPMQQKLRRIMPMPVGCVFIEWPGMTEDDVRNTMREIKAHGFNCLKQIMSRRENCGGLGGDKILHIALDEGLIPWWYGTGGYEAITDELLDKLGIDKSLDIDDILEHPKMKAHQEKLMRERIDREHKSKAKKQKEKKKKQRDKSMRAWTPSMVPGVNAYNLEEHEAKPFWKWLKKKYKDVEELRQAWNAYHIGGMPADWETWDDVLEDLVYIPQREYRFLTDVLRFKAEEYLEHGVQAMIDERDKTDPHMPVRRGGEMSLFLPFASRGTDMEGIAIKMAEGGSFYPSTHPTWHYEEIDFEYVRGTYMYDSLAHDWAKGIWTATWESTGGPQYFSGGKAPFVPEVRDKFPGFTIDVGAIKQFMMSHLAAGYRGFGIWTWNPRIAGWEAGEFALTDRNGKPTQRAVEAGKVGKAAERLRRELWAAHKEPLVGVLQDFDNEAMWAAMSATGREMYKMAPVKARVGASRALINGNIPWEYVTARNLQQGLAPRYKVIYMPAFIRLSDELLDNLIAYVEQGGRVVLDMPSSYYDEYGRLLRTDEGTKFEKLFGAVFHEYGFTNNVEWKIDGQVTEGFVAVLSPTRAKVVKTFHNGDPAITEATLGKGTAVIIGAQPALNAFRPGNDVAEQLIREHSLGEYASPYACDGAIVYRLATPDADHYFFMNDQGEDKQVTLDTKGYSYKKVSDPVEEQDLELGAPIHVDANSARWLRFEKA